MYHHYRIGSEWGEGVGGQQEDSEEPANGAVWTQEERQVWMCCVSGCAVGHCDRQPERNVYAILRSPLFLENQQNRAGK